MLHTPICDYFGIKYPIVLAGMGSVAMHRLAAAVSNAGGLGVIGAAGGQGVPVGAKRHTVHGVRMAAERLD
jgi:NAD(P)H-dependent flavin oxidoreductase YrpB (nitropropane dioxygenase family)